MATAMSATGGYEIVADLANNNQSKHCDQKCTDDLVKLE